MEVIYVLIPGMILLGLVMVGVLVWAVKSGQYDDLEGDAQRILMDDDDPLLPKELPKELPKQSPDQQKKEAGKNWPDVDEDNAQ
ncbi:cbb3-type cytochrome oxidase assembly protein CcoS [Kaarinaea lacus]